MLRLLPFILVPLLVLGGLGYWRYTASKSSLTVPVQNEAPIEVPKTLPQATVKPSATPAPSTQTIQKLDDSRINSLDAQITELKARVSVLEKATPALVVSSSQSTVYIPLGSGGSWGSTDWYTTNEYQISLDPANYPKYTGMVLEVTLRMVESVGTASVRLYNTSDNYAISSQLDTTSTSFVLVSSSSFKLATGSKTYKLQVKTSEGRDMFIQSARIRVNF